MAESIHSSCYTVAILAINCHVVLALLVFMHNQGNKCDAKQKYAVHSISSEIEMKPVGE